MTKKDAGQGDTAPRFLADVGRSAAKGAGAPIAACGVLLGVVMDELLWPGLGPAMMP
jgi:hypothetical protein